MTAAVGPTFNLDPAFPQLKALVIERTGHFYYQDKDDLLWERVRKRLRATGDGSCGQYVERLNDPFLGQAEWQRLEAEITIGETFFFRYVEQFAALRDRIIPEMIERKQAEKRLRIWSAGCSNGAEAYSLAILVTELLGEALTDWRVSIVGTDINETFLDTARSARFGEWALRSLTPDQKAAYFVPAPGRAQWQLRPQFRSLVKFDRHNLLSLVEGTSPLQFTEFDLILCRNVLIYFHPTTVHRVVEALRDALSEGGWMLLGHAEPNPGFASIMRALSLPGTTAYRRLPGDGSPWELELVPTEEVPAWVPILPVSQTPRPEKVAPGIIRLPAAPTPPAAAANDTGTFVCEVRRLADAGKLGEADAICKRGLAERPVDPVLHFYRGLIARALERNPEAEKAFRDSVYLDKNFVMAHYHLGLHLISTGQPGLGQRSLANAARIAAAMPPGRLLDEADGLMAGEFKALARDHLASASRSRSRV